MIKRPLLRYHGGKFILADWIISHFPEHKVYTESFGGGASVLLKKKRSYAEVYNDIDSEVVNLFKVCRQHGTELIRLLELTPYSRKEFIESYNIDCDEIELARKTLIRSFMGFGSGIGKTGFRAASNRSGTTPAHDWVNYPEALKLTIKRLQGVIIENRQAIDIIKQHDSFETLHYLDPPYKKSTRFKGEKTDVYKFELSDEDHCKLLNEVFKFNGMFIISGYDNELYNDILTGWKKSIRKALADGAKERIEVLWISPNCKQQQKLF